VARAGFREHLDAIAGPANQHGAWVIWDAAMERILFDSQPCVHPGAHAALAGRTVTVGSASKELRMIGPYLAAQSARPHAGRRL